jgi:hypothetical protein
MQDTVDQAAALPRTLAQIIEDARSAVCGHCLADSRRGRARSAVPARTGCTWPGSPARRSLISEADMAVVLEAAGHVFTFTDATVIFASAR